jgi:VWFA-related protein
MSGGATEFVTAILAAALCVAPVALSSQNQDRAPEQAQNQTQNPQQGQQQPQPTPAPTTPITPAGPPAPPPEPNAENTIRRSSDLVRIDVEVTDKSGKSLKGLHPEQFSVTDDGKPQQISIFTYQDIEAMETATADNSKPIVVAIDSPARTSEAVQEQIRDHRMIVLFFDLSSMQQDDIERARVAASKFVEKQMTNADLVSIVAYASRLTVWADFTNDRRTLAKAVAKLTPNVASDISNPLYAAAQNGEYDVQEYTGAAFTADETEFNAFNTDQKLLAVQGLVNVLGAIPGRKAVIEFTGGITQTGEENRTELRAATDAANRADVSIYSIDARGLFAEIPGGDVTANAATGTSMFTGASVYHQMDSRQDSRDTLATLASDTGGRAFFDLGDLSEAFPKIQQENGGYYLLGYYLGAGVKHDGRWRPIRVKVNAAGVHVRYRTGYYAPRDFQHLQNEGRQEQMADAMHSDNPVVELPLAVETSMFRLSDQQVYVPIAAKLSSSALEWAEKSGRRETAFDFAAQVRAAPSGQSVAELQDTIHVKLDPQMFQQVNQSSLLYQGGVVLAPGTYHLKFLARENETGRIGTFEQNLNVPAAQPTKLTLSSVLLSSQLVPVEKSAAVQTKAQGTRAAKIGSTPLEMEGERIIPSVTRFFTQQQTLYVFFQAYYPAKREKGEEFDPASLRAGLIFFRNGLQINATPLLAPTTTDAKAHTASFRISLPLAKLPSGRYAVQAVVIGAGTQQAAFGRAYLAVQREVATAAPNPASAPANPPTATPDSSAAKPPAD